MLANNETGVLNPIKEISRTYCRQRHSLHSDIVPSIWKVEIECKELGLDFASVSPHKIGSLNNLDLYMQK